MLAFMLMIAAVVPAFGQAAGDLMGTQWQLMSIAGDPLPDDITISLEFSEENRAGGTGGCNNYGASYAVDGESLSFSGAISTMMACAEGIMAQEAAYFAALETAVSYTLNGDELTITTADGEQLVFNRAITLDGSAWQLASLGGETAVGELTLNFGDDNRIAGSGGCNRFNSVYTVMGETISISEILSTRRACLDEASSAQEQAYFAALQAAASYTLSGDQLTIRYGDNQEMVFSRVMTLANTAWELVSYGGMDVAEGNLVTLEFGEDGRAVGSGGCNQYGGGYTSSGGSISFTQTVTTERACLDANLMEQEQAYYAALASATGYALTADTLTITYGDGEQLVFRPAATMSSSAG
jgi:heat shock protein HslJ